jgi:glycosyltransferase involved in cell wall biosynthesis
MNILLVFPLYCHHSGGHRNAALGVVRSLLHAGVEVSAISPFPPNGETPPESSTIEDCRLDQIFYMKNAEGMAAIASRYDCAIVWDYKGLSLEIIKEFQEIKLPYCYYSGGVLHYRNVLHGLKKFVYCNFLTSVFRKASAIVLPTQREYRRLKYLLPLYHGYSTSILHEVSTTHRKENCRTQETFRIGFLGRIDIRHKGLDILLEAVAMARKTDRRIQLELAGPDFQNNRTMLEQQASTLGIEGCVTFSGPLYGDDKQRFFNRIDLFVQLSRWEAFGIGIVEAMRSGTPVLLSEKANLAEELNAVGACSTTELNAKAVSRKISSLSQDRNLLENFAREGYEWATTECSAESIGRQTLELLTAVCQKNQPRR